MELGDCTESLWNPISRNSERHYQFQNEKDILQDHLKNEVPQKISKITASVFLILCYRVMAACILGTLCVAIFCTSFPKFYWLIFCSNWGVVITTMYFILAATNTMSRNPKSILKQQILNKVRNISCNVSIAITPVISIVYWVWLHSKEEKKGLALNLISVITHSFPWVLSWSDVLLIGHKIYIKNIYQAAIISGIYTLFNLCYCLLGGKSPNGKSYIYFMTNWKENVKQSALVSLVIFSSTLLAYFIIWGLRKIRSKITKIEIITTQICNSEGVKSINI